MQEDRVIVLFQMLLSGQRTKLSISNMIEPMHMDVVGRILPLTDIAVF